MKTSQRGIAAILKEEGESLTAYFDIAGVPTISVGVTDGVTADDVQNKRTISKEESQAMFAQALAPREAAVDQLCKVQPTQNQFDALVSLVYNIGEGAFAKSSVLKAHNAGDFEGAAQAMHLWNKARVGGVLQPVKGLTDRRAREAGMYMEQAMALPPAPSVRAIGGFMSFIFKLFSSFKKG